MDGSYPHFDVTDCCVEGHFVQTSWKHTPKYVNKLRLFENPERLSIFSSEIANRFKSKHIDRVLGPVGVGTGIASLVAYHHGTCAAFADKDEQAELFLRARFRDVIKNERVLIVDDIYSTGQTLKKLANLVNIAGGEVVGAAVLVNRSGIPEEHLRSDGIEAVVTLAIEQWAPHKCPLCRAGIPIDTEYGHGRQYLLNHRIRGR